MMKKKRIQNSSDSEEENKQKPIQTLDLHSIFKYKQIVKFNNLNNDKSIRSTSKNS